MLPADFALVDAHHHLWDLRDGRHPWLHDDATEAFFLGDYSAIKQNYFPADYQRDSAGLGVVKTVHCEAEWARDDQVGETRWLTEINARFGMPHAIIAHVWFHTENSADVLRAHAKFPLVRGIRSKPVTAPSPQAMRRGMAGSMTDPRWREGYARLAEHGFSWDLRIPYWHLYEAADVVAAHPEIPVVLNHTGFPWDRSPVGLAAWRDAMRAIAHHSHVHLKVSELGLPDAPWDRDSNQIVVRDAIEIFGVERCMFASNFPVAGLRVSYADLVRDMVHMTSHLSDQEQRAFFHDNATAFYRL